MLTFCHRYIIDWKKSTTFVSHNIAEKLSYSTRLLNFEIYKIQHKTYWKMKDNLEQYEKLNKEMEKEIKKAKLFYKDLAKAINSFKNLRISWEE